MSTSIGSLVLFSSYRDKKEEIYKFSVFIPLAVAFCGILASLAVFSFVIN